MRNGLGNSTHDIMLDDLHPCTGHLERESERALPCRGVKRRLGTLERHIPKVALPSTAGTICVALHSAFTLLKWNPLGLLKGNIRWRLPVTLSKCSVEVSRHCISRHDGLSFLPSTGTVQVHA